MRYLSKFRNLDSIPSENILQFQCTKFKNYKASTHSKSSKFRNSRTKTQETQTETNKLPSIFNSITEILGTPEESIDSCGVSSFQDTHVRSLKPMKEPLERMPSVCRSAQVSALEETQLRKSMIKDDVSPIVHKITEIIRGQDATVPFEECLEKSGFSLHSDIVDKVLKRCFKVGHLAYRFFNWAKLQNGYYHTTSTYNTMLYIAGEAKEFGLVDKLVEEMEMESCSKDVKTWTILISSYGKVNMIGRCLHVFESMRKYGCEPDGMAYKLIVRMLCAAGKADIALEFYKEMVIMNMEVDMNLYKQLLNCLSRSGNLSAVRLIGDDMINVSQIPEQVVYSCMLRCFCISGRIEEAIELLHELKSKKITLDPTNYEILVKGLCNTGRVADALEIIEIMKQNQFVDGKIYGIVITGHLKRGEFEDAFEVFTVMKESGHLPKVWTYTELIQHLFRSNEYERACKLYREMLENGVEPDVVAFTALITGHVQHNHVTEAWEIFNHMKDKGVKPTPKFCLIFIKELCKVARTYKALELLNEMRSSKMNISDEMFRLVISSSERKGAIETAEKVKQIWRAIYSQENDSVYLPTNHQSPDVATNSVVDICQPTEFRCSLKPTQLHPLREKVLLEPLCRVNSDFQENFTVLQICRILSSSMNWSSMQEALEKHTIQFTPELVLDVLQRCQHYGNAALNFFSWVGSQSDYSHTAETYNMAIKLSGSGKDFKHMRNLYLEMRRKGSLVTSETWTIMIMQYARAGLTEIAIKKFKEMISDGCKPNGNTFKYLLMFLCGKKGRKVDEAVKLFHDMIRAKYVPDKELVEIYLNCLCEVGKVSDAQKCREYLCKSGFSKPLSYSLVIRALCRAGRLDEALAMVDEVGEERSKLDQYIYGSLVHGLLRAGRVDEALAKVDKMKEEGTSPTVHVYTSLIVHFFKKKQIEKALEFFKKMGEDGCEPTIVTFSALIRGYMNMEMVSDAWNVFRRMKLKGPIPDFKTYSMFMTCLCEIGRSEEALQLLYEMPSSGIIPSSINFHTVYYGLNREGKNDLAHTVLQRKWDLMNKRKLLS
ncbi:putative pentatricopeptide repeat-containing protein At5g06400, mitochondrial [Papaver somniferum]|uniref:putative pentatricopeptide repeat-containing protein At5g06400, mitochondrial n=1 Tax=Papaver somniferum TaxID=3469 RepID=UPI000E6FBA70|nr:putative pentatricopeptide repeat-containing protein At5g06400, mitochondrial [Papaver somniferum]